MLAPSKHTGTIALEDAKRPEPPQGWVRVRLGNILSSLETGRRPRGGAVNDPSGVLSISAEHMTDQGRINTSIPRFVPHEFYKTMTTGHLHTGDILVVKDGATTGKTAYVDASLQGTPVVANEHVFVCRTFPASIDARWVFFYLWSDLGYAQIRACLRGSAQGGVDLPPEN